MRVLKTRGTRRHPAAVYWAPLLVSDWRAACALPFSVLECKHVVRDTVLLPWTPDTAQRVRTRVAVTTR